MIRLLRYFSYHRKMEHYYTSNPNRIANRKRINFRFLTVEESFISDDCVFSKDTLDFGSRVLLETIIDNFSEEKVLDLGCGLGYIGIMLKKYHPNIKLTMVDINETAVQLALENSALYKQDNNVYVSDGFNNIKDKFDVIVSNPPIRTGKENMYRMFKDGLDHLNNEGKMVLVIRKQQGALSAIKYLTTLGCQCDVVNKESGYWIIEINR